MKDLCVELKVCEGCGALWLRPVSHGTYCHGCARWIADCPLHMEGKKRGRKSKAKRAATCNGGAR